MLGIYYFYNTNIIGNTMVPPGTSHMIQTYVYQSQRNTLFIEQAKAGFQAAASTACSPASLSTKALTYSFLQERSQCKRLKSVSKSLTGCTLAHKLGHKSIPCWKMVMRAIEWSPNWITNEKPHCLPYIEHIFLDGLPLNLRY